MSTPDNFRGQLLTRNMSELVHAADPTEFTVKNPIILTSLYRKPQSSTTFTGKQQLIRIIPEA